MNRNAGDDVIMMSLNRVRLYSCLHNPAKFSECSQIYPISTLKGSKMPLNIVNILSFRSKLMDRFKSVMTSSWRHQKGYAPQPIASFIYQVWGRSDEKGSSYHAYKPQMGFFAKNQWAVTPVMMMIGFVLNHILLTILPRLVNIGCEILELSCF